MEKSIVYVSAKNDEFACNYAIIDKGEKSVIIIFKGLELIIYDYDEFLKDNFQYDYLLFKYYPDETLAYKDFLKLIGKMCKKDITSKYFKNHLKEDNTIIFIDDKNEHMIDSSNNEAYLQRKNQFITFIKNNKTKFII